MGNTRGIAGVASGSAASESGSGSEAARGAGKRAMRNKPHEKSRLWGAIKFAKSLPEFVAFDVLLVLFVLLFS